MRIHENTWKCYSYLYTVLHSVVTSNSEWIYNQSKAAKCIKETLTVKKKTKIIRYLCFIFGDFMSNCDDLLEFVAPVWREASTRSATVQRLAIWFLPKAVVKRFCKSPEPGRCRTRSDVFGINGNSIQLNPAAMFTYQHGKRGLA